MKSKQTQPKNKIPNSPRFAFFGTPDIAVTALEEMMIFGFVPTLVVCNPDAPAGRQHTITPPPTKIWAERHNLPVWQPTTFKNHKASTPLTDTQQFDFFMVLAYGKIMPQWLIDLPKFGTINAHPSLLPKLRGASPIRSTLLYDLSACGVTIIQMDNEIDHGPSLAQTPYDLYGVPILGRKLDTILAKKCGRLLVSTSQQLTAGQITPIPQDHTKATFSTKITKRMAKVELDPHHLPTGVEALTLYRQICAFDGWPGAFFFYNGQRIKITSADYNPTTQILSIEKIIPESKKETNFNQYFTNH